MLDVKNLTREQLAGMFDHTFLKAYATKADFEKLCGEAKENGFAMVAINSSPVAMCKELLKDTKVHVGAAIGFPLGQTTIDVKAFETEKAIEEGADEIEAMMKNFRSTPLTSLGGSPVSLIKDFGKLEGIDFVSNENIVLEMPTTSNVIQYFTEEGTKLSIRPSGTEPKIKFYIEVTGSAKTREELAQAKIKTDEKIDVIRQELGI